MEAGGSGSSWSEGAAREETAATHAAAHRETTAPPCLPARPSLASLPPTLGAPCLE